MRRLCFVLSITIACGNWLLAQTQPSDPQSQTARQALIEMFLGKNADAFEKHLPDVARQALIRKNETADTSTVLRIGMFGRQMVAQKEKIEIFDVGPTLLTWEEARGQQKVEVLVEHDSLMGDEDEIEVSIHPFRTGEPEFWPVFPSLKFSMKQEKEVWRLSEVTVAARVPLTDPEYLKGVRKQQDEENENMAAGRVTMFATAERSYALQHADRGYTCKLADALEAASIDAAFAGGESFGYRFAVFGCDGSPVSKYQISAVPTEAGSEMKAFCSDESGVVRFAADGKGSTCLRHGELLNPTPANSPGTMD